MPDIEGTSDTVLPEMGLGVMKGKTSGGRGRMLWAQAPLVPAGVHLDYWDSREASAIPRMEVYNHWGPVDQDVTLPAERISQLFGTLATYYQPPPVRFRSPRFDY